MPKGPPRENRPCAPSKTVKEKSNSSTILAICDGKNGADANRRGSCCSSERDSGYSDGSDWQQTDVEDQRSSTSQQTETSSKGQNKGFVYRTTENPAMMPAKLDHTPIDIIKDMVLNQPPVTQKGSPLLLSNSIICGSLPVLVFEQPSLTPASMPPHKPLLQTSSSAGKKTNSTYLPILNSYPRIAPHPSKKPADKPSNRESQIRSKRMCTEQKTDETHATKDLPDQHNYKQPKLSAQNPVLSRSALGRHCSSSSPFTTTSPSLGSASSSSVVRGPYRNVTTSSHHFRFLNTVELLQQSGLLDITLRTKDLLRQSSSTEQDISQLWEHIELLCRADDNTNLSTNTGWEHLYQAMVESGGYPDLKIPQKSQNSSYPFSRPEGISGDMNRTQAAESSEVSPFTTFTDSQVRRDKKLEACDKIPDKVTFMCPDSSTTVCSAFLTTKMIVMTAVPDVHHC